MSDNLIEIKCPRCGHVWQVDVTQLEAASQEMFKVLLRGKPKPKKTSYRVSCPNDGTSIVVEVEEVSDD